MTIKRLTPLLFLAFIMNVNGQLSKDFKGTFFEANYSYMTQDYQHALTQFGDLLDVDPGNSNLNFLCGDCCFRIPGKQMKAISYLKRAVRDVDPSYKWGSYKESHAPSEAFLLLAKTYQMRNEFSKAINIYETYRESSDLKFSEIEFVNRQIQSCELGMKMILSPLKVKFQAVMLDESKEYSNSNPVISGDESMMIYLVNNTDNSAIKMVRKQGTEWSKPQRLNIQLSVTGNFKPVSLSYDGTELYLVQDDYYNADIFVSHFSNNRWSKAEMLNKNVNTRYHELHACISRDGNTLLFTSNRKGGQGGMDIYSTERDSDGNWTEAKNLGPTINTFYDERTPFVTKDDSKLYFSSEGQATMGGFDIFSSEWNQDGTWSAPQNLGYPISTSSDDLFYNPGWNDVCGYYAWEVQDQAIKNIKMIFILPDDEPIAVTAEKMAEEKVKSNISKKKPEFQGEYRTLNSILFDFNQYRLTQSALHEVERVYAVMSELPETNIELTGHKDLNESDRPDMLLSTRRANSVAQCLIEQGIAPERIVVRELEELSIPEIVDHGAGADVSDGSILNRHTSIKISNLPDDKDRVAEILVPDRLSPIQDLRYSVLLTENEQIIKKMPEEYFGQKVSLVSTDSSNFYIAGNFDRKSAAVKYLNEAIDYGFPEARIMTEKDLELIISGRSEGDNKGMPTFTIQIMALRRSRDVSYFRSLGVVMKYAGNDGINRYTFGAFASKEDAKEEMLYVRKKGYPQAFIISTDRFASISGQQGPSAIVVEN